MTTREMIISFKMKASLMEFKPNNKQLEFFTHLIYKSLDNEINANVSQTYTYLRGFDSSDEDFLKEKLEEYDVRKEYKSLLNFNIDKFKKDLQSNNISLHEFNSILIKNGVGQFLDFVKNKKSDDKYIDSWFKIINSNINKLLVKQDGIVKEVIEDINLMENYSSEYPIEESTILNFNEYLNENLNNTIL